jgi:FkbM family methyltransferase
MLLSYQKYMLKTQHKIRIANLIWCLLMPLRRAFGFGYQFVGSRGGINWELDLREGIDFSIWLLGAFEPSTVRQYRKSIRPGSVVVDVGANIGAHTLPLADCVGKTGRVFAFEPTDFAFGKLLANCKRNPILAERIKAHQVMLVAPQNTDLTITPALYSSWPLQVSSGLHNLHGGRLMPTLEARSQTLDDVLSKEKFCSIDFIKLDIDGYECDMLRGAFQTISQYRPEIIMELAPYALKEAGSSLAELVSLISSFGYIFFDIGNNDQLPMDALVLEDKIPVGASINVIARAIKPFHMPS